MIKQHVFRSIHKSRDVCSYFSCKRPAADHISVIGFRTRKARLANERR